VAGDGQACHTGERSCFYRALPLGAALGVGAALGADVPLRRT